MNEIKASKFRFIAYDLLNYKDWDNQTFMDTLQWHLWRLGIMVNGRKLRPPKEAREAYKNRYSFPENLPRRAK